MQPSPADPAMLAYYADRAGVYDRIYARESLNNWSRRAADERDSVGFLN